jgi:hypothetical protein
MELALGARDILRPSMQAIVSHLTSMSYRRVRQQMYVIVQMVAGNSANHRQLAECLNEIVQTAIHRKTKSGLYWTVIALAWG